ncbi:MAG: 16S rRNA (cytosine(967)-C(5))-methyltransferase RsmB, partial [Deltaproteobacteria bacterium]|nr:16S rRNA (cytosine(967)-C(5))-methyltransferase RsmB [Deltaproteobacteria bacterium]
MPHDPRKTALDVLNTLSKGKKTLDSILSEIPQHDRYLSRKDRALFTAMVFGVLRWRNRLDHIILHFSKTPIQKIEPAVLNILRLGLFQIIYLDRVPDSAAVNTSVEMTKQIGAFRATGFVNALLRKSAKNYNGVDFPAFEKDPIAFLSAGQSLPGWLAKRWLKRFDRESLMILSNTINSVPPITIRTNTLKTAREQLILSLENEVERIEPATTAPDGIRLFNPKRAISDLSAFNNGWFQVQDEAAQLVSLLLDPQPAESVLDACAGLGGKTAHLAQLMRNQGHLVAMDKDEKKLQQLDSEMQRLGVSVVRTTCCDLNLPLDPKRHGSFDRILLDAPCSGLGVLRRNPDIKWTSSEADLKRHAGVQKRFLENLAERVKLNGILVYAVCSIEPEENETVIKVFLKKHPEFVIDKNLGKLPETLHSLVEP